MSRSSTAIQSTPSRGFLDDIAVAAPCFAPLDTMPGDARVRHCTQCGLSVYNLSAMTRAQAEAFLSAREGPTCIRFYRRKDGSVQTRDCPEAVVAFGHGSRNPSLRLVALGLLLLGLVIPPLALVILTWIDSATCHTGAIRPLPPAAGPTKPANPLLSKD